MRTNNKQNLKTLTLAALAGILVAGCGQRDAHFEILGKSQGLISAPANNKVDILWVIRNAGLMGPIQTTLANSISSFMTQFVTKNFDYQMSVVTTDIRPVDPLHPNDPNFSGQNACIVGNPAIITTTTPNPIDVLAANSNVGFFGTTDSHNLGVFQAAFTAPNLGGCNTGFLRTGAYLAVIEVSDTDDDTTVTPADALAFLDTIRPPATTPSGATLRPYSVSAMVVDNLADKAACDAIGDTMFGTHGVSYTELGTKLMSIATTTGGVIGNVCAADFSASLLAMGTHILEQTSAVHLASIPNQSTIQVFQGSTTILPSATDGWTFDANTTSIVFHGSAIPIGASVFVTVNYTPVDIVR
ncbi:MAG: hypothetical protein HY074_05430 [Deltaproteobacteria bacterium]|nr:hypothetical protein [Deltaproteobacteria bacterium]